MSGISGSSQFERVALSPRLSSGTHGADGASGSRADSRSEPMREAEGAHPRHSRNRPRGVAGYVSLLDISAEFGQLVETQQALSRKRDLALALVKADQLQAAFSRQPCHSRLERPQPRTLAVAHNAARKDRRRGGCLLGRA